MIGAQDEQSAFTGNRILGNHPDPGFDIAAVKIAQWAQLFEVGCQRSDRGGNIDVDPVIRLDKV